MPVETRYFRADTWTVNGLSARRLQTTNSSFYNDLSVLSLSNVTFSLSFTIAVRQANGTEAVIGSNVAQMTRSTDGQGYQTAIWSCPRTSLPPSSALRVTATVEGGSWQATGNWISEQLSYSEIDATTWHFICYTYREFFDVYEYYFYFGASYHNSRIENISFSTAAGGVVEASSSMSSSSSASASPFVLLSAASSSSSSFRATCAASKTASASSIASSSSSFSAITRAIRSIQSVLSSSSSFQAAASKTSFASSFASSYSTFSAVITSAAQALAEALLFCSSLASASLTLVKKAVSYAEASASSSAQALASRLVKAEAKGGTSASASLKALLGASTNAKASSTVQAKPRALVSARSSASSLSSLTASAFLKLFEIVLFSSRLKIKQPVSSELKIKKVERLR